MHDAPTHAYSAHEKTLDLRLERIGRDAARAIGIASGTYPATSAYAERTIANLLEERALVSAWIARQIADIARTHSSDEQNQKIDALAEPHAAILRADVAIARLRHAISAQHAPDTT